MDFQQLLAKMVELDQPTTEMAVAEEPNEGNEFSGALKAAKDSGQDEFEVDGKKYKVKEDGSVEECGMGPMNNTMDNTPPVPEPSMSLNLNAQGMDNIESLMKLMTKVNPDMINQPDKGISPMPGMSAMPGPSPMGMGNLDAGPLKMLPDFDADNDDMPGGEKDMPDMDMKKDKEEAFANSLDDSEPETMDMDAAIPNGNDLHKQKSMHRAAAGGDNPMKAESGDLRAQIRAELLQRLAEAKGAK